jgi:hypothetical protein
MIATTVKQAIEKLEKYNPDAIFGMLVDEKHVEFDFCYASDENDDANLKENCDSVYIRKSKENEKITD